MGLMNEEHVREKREWRGESEPGNGEYKLTFSNQQYGFMPVKSTTDALFALRVLMEK